LTIDRSKGAISLDWKDLFTRFFGAKRMMDRVLECAPISDVEVAQLPPEAQVSDYGPVPAYHIAKLRPALQALGLRDIETLQSHSTDTQARRNRIGGLSDPVHMWITTTAGYTKGSSKVAILNNCRLRRKADQEVYLDDDGAVDKAKIEAENTVDRGQIFAMKEENNHRAKTCDACREGNTQCKQQPTADSMCFDHLEVEGANVLENFDFDSFLRDDDFVMHFNLGGQDLALSGPGPCNTCAASNVRCEFTLADFNRGMSRLIARGPPERAYQERMMLLDQQSKEPSASWPR